MCLSPVLTSQIIFSTDKINDSKGYDFGHHFSFLCRLDANNMGLVCSVALMGDPMTESDTEGSVLALKRMKQVIADEGKYEVTKSVGFPTYKASVADLDKIPVQGVQMVSCYIMTKFHTR